MKDPNDPFINNCSCGGELKSRATLRIREMLSNRKTIRTRCKSCGRAVEFTGPKAMINELLFKSKALATWMIVASLLCLSFFHNQGYAANNDGDSDCQDWFKETGIDPTSSSCEMDCAMTPADMGNFACVAQCESLCKPNCRSPKPGGCEFYRSCVEDKIECGQDGYAIGYGEKYCRRFRALGKSDLSHKGLEWRNYTLSCLQNILAELLFSSSYVNTCSELKTYAFKSHVFCYTHKDHSVCDLKVGDWATISTTVDFRDALSEEGRVQVLEVIKLCKGRIVGQRDQVLAVLESPFGISTLDGETTHDKARRQLQEIDQKIKYIESLR